MPNVVRVMDGLHSTGHASKCLLILNSHLDSVCLLNACVCRWGFLGIVKTLIEEHHADPNAKDSKGLTPFLWACR